MHDLCLLNDNLVQVVFKRKQEYVEESKVTNLFIGIFTTAWARLELYNLIDLLGDSVLYVDTDSCVYVSKPGSPNPATGDFLGDLTNEITPKHGQGAYITHEVCSFSATRYNITHVLLVTLVCKNKYRAPSRCIHDPTFRHSSLQDLFSSRSLCVQ